MSGAAVQDRTALALDGAHGALARLEPVSLAEVQVLADLQTRVDRKYVVGPEVVERLVTEVLTDASVLTIDGRTSFRYESVYFDTPDLTAYRDAAHGRRLRFKVRTRAYLDTDACVLEVKTSGGRDQTVKQRMDYDIEDRMILTPAGQAFVLDCLARSGPTRSDRAVDVASLRPAATTAYRRSTVVDLVAGTRLTVDADLVVSTPDSASVRLTDQVVLETKSTGRASAADHWLWTAGHRPSRISKYCVGLAALDAALPANRWAQTLARHF
ncbi:polyphosphate polymerase domain-containing protein [Cellulomonas sp. KRMCY2]|uniref:polyphosphate polymerase domain-containing protein n=1 Tax=Cellulomonas sp. KRMCY2 TaxID=1304865 RepID=UPI00068821F3|nr:polyphosphate polymerase domain-containing protein [Cellulomonas sp. KRMCY2]